MEDNKSTLETTTQWVAHDGLILQQTQLRYSGQESIHLQCRLPSGDNALDIRDLDHVDAYYPLYVKYKQVFGPHQYSWVFVRELDRREPRTTNESGQRVWEDSIAVVTSIMQDGNLIQWKVPQEAPPASSQASTITAETPGQTWDIMLEADSSTEIVIAYKMALAPKSQFHTWDSFIISADAMDVSAIMSREIPCPDTLRLSDIIRKDSGRAQPRSLPATPQDASEHIEFVVHRHLEHILSNCSIPIIPRTIRSVLLETTLAESRETQLTEDRIVPVALTCGDVSFHRVSGSSSFFAFTFLVEILGRLRNYTHKEDPYIQHLTHRIETICKGHIHWLRTAANGDVDKGFGANYWVSGKPIDGSNSPTWLPKDSLLDTAFQIIKVEDYSELDGEFGATARSLIQGATCNWMAELKEKEHRKSLAWAHACESLPTFRLDDHVWIWRALKATDHPDMSTYLKNNEASKKPATIFSYREVQREMLRHFTTRNDDIFGTRMLAVTRSCRETRFLLHARDTILFHALEWGFPLDEPPTRELWANTIESQSRHDENHEEQWDNSLRYALAVVMGCRGYSLNKRTPQDLLKSSLSTLLESSSPNGLFAGQLDATTKKPICFFREEDRDFHLHCTFEIPYILLAYSSRITTIPSEETQKRQNPDAMLNATPVRGNMEIPDFEKWQELVGLQEKMMSPNHQWTAGIPGPLLRPLGKPVVYKKRQPFYHLLDSTNIVEMEEEWLYNYPAFLEDKSISAGSDANLLMMTYLLEGMDLSEQLAKKLLLQSPIILDIIWNDEELRMELCDSLSYGFSNSRLIAQIVLAIYKDSGSTERAVGPQSGAAKESIITVLRVSGRWDDLKPEDNDATRSSNPTVAESPPQDLPIQLSSKSKRRWYSIRTLTNSSSRPVPDSSTEKLPAPDDPRVQVLEDLLVSSGLGAPLRSIIKRYIDVFVLFGLNFPALPERVAAILGDDDAMLARILLGQKFLYKELQKEISQQVANGSWIRQEIKRYMDNLLLPHDDVPLAGKAPVDTVPQQHDVRPSSKEAFAKSYILPDGVNFDDCGGAFVVDTTKKISQGRNPKAQGRHNILSGVRIPNDDLWHEVLKSPRTPKKAKKRFIWLPDASQTTALVCVLGSPPVERDPMTLFFDRHSNYELYFFDDTTPHLNTWETELHISFYQVLETGKSQPIGMTKPFREPFPSKTPCDLTKASMGFRFFGDFFDRYWTCHFIEYVPSDGSEKTWDLPFDSSSSMSSKNREWKQRKVLELYLFERIVTKVVNSTREIYNRVRRELGVSGEVFSMVALDSGDYFSSSEHWQKCQETLQVVEDRLEHIATEIAKWDSRERDRGAERPRWTRRDERKYSGEIKKRLGSSNSKVRDLRRLKADITVLKDLLVSRQDQIRNDLSLRSDENIRFLHT
ncbi:hypothetical protein PG997_014194 [Apiospora hydei]|uniref:Uncharacterized protein n=1 Tax=Apiospora hydei TaxID=1337664 RepID=A0ABR1UT75_9PEZI